MTGARVIATYPQPIYARDRSKSSMRAWAVVF
jgi:hypothetical protein